MIRDLMIRSVQRYGGDKKLADRLLIHGEKTYFTWIVRSLVDPNSVYDSLYALAEVLDMPLTRIKYSYFSAKSTPVGELRKLPEYDEVMKILHEMDDLPSLWSSLQKYCFGQLKRICVEELVAREETVLSIMDKLNASHGYVYNVRRAYIKRELKEKEIL